MKVQKLSPNGWFKVALVTGAVFTITGSSAIAEEPGDVKVSVTRAEKSATKGAADLLIVNETDAVLTVDMGTTPVQVPIGKELALKVVRGTDPIQLTEYRWGVRGKPGKTTMGWIPWKQTAYESRLGLKGQPKKHLVKKPGGNKKPK